VICLERNGATLFFGNNGTRIKRICALILWGYEAPVGGREIVGPTVAVDVDFVNYLPQHLSFDNK